MNEAEFPVCPSLTSDSTARVLLAHGEGARLSRRFVKDRILTRFQNRPLSLLGDSALLPAPRGRLAFTTDSFVVSPLFFPGGDIGTLAVFGTSNDLAVAGARPLWLSLSLVMEEGLQFSLVDRVLDSIAAAAEQAGVQIVAGDTKVVPRGAADGLFINTSGIGEVLEPPPPGSGALAPGDQILVSGPVGRHGMAVLAARESLALEPLPQSDCASLVPAVNALRQAGIRVRALRDATRGGVAAVLHEWSEASGCTLTVDESLIPVTPDVRGLCELLGLDPLFVANEGTLLAAIPEEHAFAALQALQSTSIGAGAALIGSIRPRSLAPVTVRRALGRELPLDEPTGAPLPRIC